MQTVAALERHAESELGLLGGSFGVGTPGSTTAAGLITNANSTCLNGQPLQRDIAQLRGRPVCTANDATCPALSDATDDAAAGAEVVFAVILGTGVGAGLAVRGPAARRP